MNDRRMSTRASGLARPDGLSHDCRPGRGSRGSGYFLIVFGFGGHADLQMRGFGMLPDRV